MIEIDFHKIASKAFKGAKELCLLILICINSCSNNNNFTNELRLDLRYLQIEKINSFAKCKGPQGAYTTQVVSTKDGGLLFSQSYEYRDQPFSAKLTPDGKGYTVNEEENILDTLSKESVEIIRSHDFHRLQTNPKHFFHQIKFEYKLDQDLEIYSGLDKLHNPVRLQYNSDKEQLIKVELLNPMDTTELIEIINKKWIDSDYGKLVKELEIIQAEKDTFEFSFESVEIN